MNSVSYKMSSIWSKPNFWVLLIIAVFIKQLPIVSVPFNWLESYFHEISHGLAAIFTGGSIARIQLFSNGAGLCTTLGGIAFVISFAGYAGAIGWGFLIFKVANFRHSFSHYLSYVLLILLSVSCIFWVRDILTLFICLVLIAMFFLAMKFKHLPLFPVLLKLIALMVLLNGLESPLYLIDGRGVGDGQALTKLTFIPEIFWILIWSAMAGFSLYRLSKSS